MKTHVSKSDKHTDYICKCYIVYFGLSLQKTFLLYYILKVLNTVSSSIYMYSYIP